MLKAWFYYFISSAEDEGSYKLLKYMYVLGLMLVRRLI